MEKIPTVSVVMITYNHEKYIQEAIEGVLMQNCDFDIEFIIANDKSTDHSDQVILNHLSKVDTSKHIKVEYTNHAVNKGMMSNFIWALKQAQGKYIALCEGDDYWTDPFKLQKQVNFLNKNEDFNGISSNSIVLLEKNKEERLFKNTEKDRVLNIEDFLSNRFFHTASFMFKNVLEFSEEFKNVLSGDRLLFLVVASKGKIFYKNETTCVYRKNDGGISKRVVSSQMIKDLFFLDIAKDFLNKTQLKTLEKFIIKTILEYSHEIRLKHFVYVATKFLIISKLDYRSRKIIKKSISKVKI
jgi:glycosyltransferase involved in cell wall biosynthesis